MTAKPHAQFVDHYEALGLSPNCFDKNEIRKAYKKLALKYHPDKNVSSDDDSASRFVAIQAAYQVLSHHEKRVEYDRRRKLWLANRMDRLRREQELHEKQEQERRVKEQIEQMKREHAMEVKRQADEERKARKAFEKARRKARKKELKKRKKQSKRNLEFLMKSRAKEKKKSKRLRTTKKHKKKKKRRSSSSSSSSSDPSVSSASESSSSDCDVDRESQIRAQDHKSKPCHAKRMLHRDDDCNYVDHASHKKVRLNQQSSQSSNYTYTRHSKSLEMFVDQHTEKRREASSMNLWNSRNGSLHRTFRSTRRHWTS